MTLIVFSPNLDRRTYVNVTVVPRDGEVIRLGYGTEVESWGRVRSVQWDYIRDEVTVKTVPL